MQTQNDVLNQTTIYYKIQVSTAFIETWHYWHDAPKFPYRMCAFEEADRIKDRYEFIKNIRVIRVVTTYTAVPRG